MRIGKIITRIIFPGMLAAGGVGGGVYMAHRVITNYLEEKTDKFGFRQQLDLAPGMSSLSWYMDRSYYFMHRQMEKLINLRDRLWLNFTQVGNIPVLQVGDPHYNNTYRRKLADTNLLLYVMTNQDHYLTEAFEVLDQGLKDADPALRWHPDIPYIRDYFELKLAKADFWLMVSRLERKEAGFYTAIDLAEEVIEEANDPDMQQAQNMITESVPGYVGRARLIQARAYESVGQNDKAKELYEQVVAWAKKQTEAGILNTTRLIYAEGKLWNARKGILYVGAQAKIQLGFIFMGEGKFEKAFELFKEVLTWEEVGDEDGPMDLGFASLIGAIHTCNFFDDLPWDTILGYSDMLEALKLDADSLKDKTPKQRVQLICRALSLIPLQEKIKDILRLIDLRL